MAKDLVVRVHKSCRSSSNWASLLGDLLETILGKLVFFLEYIRFSAVCKSWNSVALIYKENHKGKRMRVSNHGLPWLLVCRNNNNKEWQLYNFVTEEFYNSQLCTPSNKSNKALIFLGSCYGWLCFIENSALIVLDPLSGTIIDLPQLKSSIIKHYYVARLKLSRDPYLGSFEVLFTAFDFNNDPLAIAHLRHGDEFWTYSENVEGLDGEVTFYKDHKFGVTNNFEIASLDVINGQCIKINTVSPPWFGNDLISNGLIFDMTDSYFVETTNGDLLLVCRLYHERTFKTYKIFKLQIDYARQVEFAPIQNLGGDSLFIGYNCCISVLASKCMPNSIYSGYDIFIYDEMNSKIEVCDLDPKGR